MPKLPEDALKTSLQLAEMLGQVETDQNPNVAQFPVQQVASSAMLKKVQAAILSEADGARVKGFYTVFLCEGGNIPTMSCYRGLTFGESKTLIGEMEIQLARLKQLVIDAENGEYGDPDGE